VRRSACARGAPLLFALLLAFAARAEEKPWVTHWYPFEIIHNRVNVPIKINGADTTAMFDTGASVAFVDEEFAKAHGVRVSEANKAEVRGAHSTQSVPLAREVPVELFGARIPLRNVPAGKLGDAKIIIGLNVLRAFVLQIDFASSRIRFASHSAARLDETANVEMRRERSTDLPAVRATVDGEPMWLMLDTGLSGPLQLKTAFVEDRGWEKVTDSYTTDVHGKARASEIYRVPLLQLGPYDLRGVRAIVQAKGHISRQDVRREDMGVRTSGILGAEVLRQFVVTMDLKARKLHLEPAQKAAVGAAESDAPSTAPPQRPKTAGDAPAAEPAPTR
jgi:predicted aspartyl protease